MKKVVINNIEKKLNEKLSIFTFKGEREFVVRRDSNGDWESLVVLSERNNPFSAVIIESVQEVLKPYLRKHREDMYYGLDKAYAWSERQEILRSVPCMEINMKKD